MTKRILSVLALTLLLLQGCNLVYKQNIQQGNAIEQEDLDKLRIGMTKNQVSFLMGTPSIHDPFHHDRWDYVSTFSRRGGEAVMRKVTLYFENGTLSEMIGVENDNALADEETPDDEAPAEETGETAAEIEPEPEMANTGDDMTGEAAVTEVSALDTPVAEDAALEAPASEAPGEAMASEPPLPEPSTAEMLPPEDLAAEPVIESIEESPVMPEVSTEDLTEAMEDWAIQLGAFDALDNAETVLQRLQDAGYDAEILTQETAESGTRYLVRKTGIDSADTARQLLDDIAEGLGINGFVVPRGE